MVNLTGLHHVTAVTGNARRNLEFYRDVLGLRLVKKTVNQDVTSSYHLFYGDTIGHPGTEMTFFDWPQVSPNRAGVGEISATAFAVPSEESLKWWSDRFESTSTEHGAIEERGDLRVLPFQDSEGQRLELVAGTISDSLVSDPWTNTIPDDAAIRGLAYVTLTVAVAEGTHTMLELLGFERTSEYSPSEAPSHATVFETGTGGLGTQVHVHELPQAPQNEAGIGGVHHVAFRSADDEAEAAWQEFLVRHDVRVTSIIDRYYFRSIYFREPGGVLFEIATDGPGFTGDEDMDHLGEKLSLPPFLESRRAEIEAQLIPIPG